MEEPLGEKAPTAALAEFLDRDDRRRRVYAAIDRERAYQKMKWGNVTDVPASEVGHEVGGYLLLMRVHMVEADALWARSPGDVPALACVLKVAALAVACLEQHGVTRRELRRVESQRVPGLVFQEGRPCRQ